jgi:broad specificity phosphatase PhoE
MSTTVHLLRHGAYAGMVQALGGRLDHPLSEEGRLQADRVAASLAGRRIAAVMTSPVARARETAERIGARLDLVAQPDPDFTEIDYGDWTGWRFEDLALDPAWQAWNRFRSFAGAPGGETMLAVQSRAVAGLRRLADLHGDGEVVVVSHADVIKAMLAHVLGSPLDLLGRMDIGPGSVSRVVLYGTDATVLAINAPP